jgi:MFS family permease
VTGVQTCALPIYAIILIIALIGLRQVNHRFDGEVKVKELVKKVYARKNISRIYLVSFVLEFFYALAVIYTPIYLLDIGMSWEKIGWIFTAMLIPFVILQYPMGLLADKKIGEKELIITSLIIVSISTLAIYFIGSASILIWSLVLFSTRIGAAILEIMRDSYFYKRIDGNDIDLINFFRTAQSAAYIVSAVVAFLIFKLFPGGQPIKLIFLAVAAMVFLALYPAARLKDNLCEAEMNCKK